MARRQRSREPGIAPSPLIRGALAPGGGSEAAFPAFAPEEVIAALGRWWARTETLAPIVPLALLAIMFSCSWGRWAQELADRGREMNVPARILAGERLYLDIQYLYGPLAPYLNAFLYKAFGIHMLTLQCAGLACAAGVLVTVYWIARRLLDPVEAVLVSGFVLAVCGFRPAGNYIQPYAYAAAYGLLFVLVSLAAAIRYVETEELRPLAWSGLAAGLALVTKQELVLPAAGVGLLAVSFVAVSRRRVPWRACCAFAIPVLLVGAGVYGWVLRTVPLHVLIEDNHLLFTHLPPQIRFFVQGMAGFLKWPMTWWRTVASLGLVVALVGLTGCAGAFVCGLRMRDSRRLLLRSLLLLACGGAWWQILRRFFEVEGRPGTFASTSLVLTATAVGIGFLLVRDLLRDGTVSVALRTRALLVAFAALTVTRMVFEVRTSSSYAPYLLPGTLLVYGCGFLRTVPRLLAPTPRTRERLRLVCMAMLTVAVATTLTRSILQFRERNTFEVTSARGDLWLSASLGDPVADAVRFVRARTAPGDYVLTLPQATSINFLAERRNPLREEITTPGTLVGERQQEAIRRIVALEVPLILVTNVLTPEFRDRTFGVDYDRDLKRWIEQRYRPVARFDSDRSAGASFGDPPFFIVAYERLPSADRP